MAKRSLFAVLLRSPWWLSVLIAAALFMAVRQFMPDYAAIASALPFLAIAGYAGWRQSRAPNPERVGEVLAALRAMSWQEFAAIMEATFREEGYTVVALTRGAADFELRKSGRVALASCKRWKVARTGIEPLRELVQAREAAGGRNESRLRAAMACHWQRLAHWHKRCAHGSSCVRSWRKLFHRFSGGKKCLQSNHPGSA